MYNKVIKKGSCWNEEYQERKRNEKMKTILCYGDSNTHGHIPNSKDITPSDKDALHLEQESHAILAKKSVVLF